MYKLVDRLRCKYNGRDFSGPAPEGMVLPTGIMLEAADEIERLAVALENHGICELCEDAAIKEVDRLRQVLTNLLNGIRLGPAARIYIRASLDKKGGE